MSNLATSNLQDSPFLEGLLGSLMPYFIGVAPDLAAARAEALQTLASYGARTRAELLCAAQAIALGLATLDTLTEAKTTEMVPALRLRLRGCANMLARNSQKAEQILAKRLCCDPPATTPEPAAAAERAAIIDAPQSDGPQSDGPQPDGPQPDGPQPDGPQPDVQEILTQTPAAIQTQRNPTAGSRPTQSAPPITNQAKPQSVEERNKALWGVAMMETLAEMGMPVTPTAIT